MVNRELIEVFSEIAREKNVERSELATILEEIYNQKDLPSHIKKRVEEFYGMI